MIDSNKKPKALAIVALAACMFLPTGLVAANDAPPRLILQITVDALRGDLPGRYAHLFGDGGFRYLMEEGVHYTNAHYQHANTETIVGHVSLATGTVPAAHGMVGNVWFDRQDGRLVYNIEDPDHHLLTAGADVDTTTEIDPTQRAARSEGRSPAAMLVTTFADELRSSNNGGIDAWHLDEVARQPPQLAHRCPSPWQTWRQLYGDLVGLKRRC